MYRTTAAAPWTRELLAAIPSDDRASPRWIHSFGVTRSSVVVIEQPCAYDVPAMLGMRTASHGSIEWLPERGTHVHVLDRASGHVTTHVVRRSYQRRCSPHCVQPPRWPTSRHLPSSHSLPCAACSCLILALLGLAPYWLRLIGPPLLRTHVGSPRLLLLPRVQYLRLGRRAARQRRLVRL